MQQRSRPEVNRICRSYAYWPRLSCATSSGTALRLISTEAPRGPATVITRAAEIWWLPSGLPPFSPKRPSACSRLERVELVLLVGKMQQRPRHHFPLVISCHVAALLACLFLLYCSLYTPSSESSFPAKTQNLQNKNDVLKSGYNSILLLFVAAASRPLKFCAWAVVPPEPLFLRVLHFTSRAKRRILELCVTFRGGPS